jgi:uncharacterized protein YbjT (DUF2867 family)
LILETQEEHMILVVGATGTLGSEICSLLRREQAGVRALVRQSANRDRLAVLRNAGVELCMGDLKDPAGLREACEGAEVVISTASSTLSRQEGDSIETVDRIGQLSLIETARTGGVKHFTLVSIPRQPLRQSPLTRAKAEAERTLAASELDYTILGSNFFMEVWLSPALGFDVAHRKALIFGDGDSPISWVSYHDVAEFAIRSHRTPQRAIIISILVDRRTSVPLMLSPCSRKAHANLSKSNLSRNPPCSHSLNGRMTRLRRLS